MPVHSRIYLRHQLHHQSSDPKLEGEWG
jgi:hypothetical protein